MGNRVDRIRHHSFNLTTHSSSPLRSNSIHDLPSQIERDANAPQPVARSIPSPFLCLAQYEKPARIENYLVVVLTAPLEGYARQYREHFGHTLRWFTDVDEFFAFIIGTRQINLFLILSPAFAPKIVPLIHQLYLLVAIYIVDPRPAQDQHWMETYEKIQGSFRSLDRIKQDIQRQTHPSTADTLSIHSTRSATEPLMKRILLHEMNYTAKWIKKWIVSAREHYPDQLEAIDEFERSYTPATAAWWYTRKCFIHSMLTNAFRTQDIEGLLRMGFFIRDLQQQIASETVERTRVVYQGQGVSKKQLKQLQTHGTRRLSFHNFLWTNTDRTVPLNSAHLASNAHPDAIGALFRMTIGPRTPFLRLENTSYYLDCQTDVLLPMYSTFRIGAIEQTQDRIWQIDLTIIDDREELVGNVAQSIHNETAWQKFSRHLLRTKQLEQVEKLYRPLLESNSIRDSEQRASISEELGSIYRQKHDYIHALSSYKRALEIHSSFSPPNHSHLCSIHRTIGDLHSRMKNYTDARKHLEIALIMASDSSRQVPLEREETQVPIDHLSVASINGIIGETYRLQHDYGAALPYYEAALVLQKKALPPNHFLLAVTCDNLAKVLHRLRRYKEAVDYAAQAVTVARQALGPTHETVRMYEESLKKLRQRTFSGAVF